MLRQIKRDNIKIVAYYLSNCFNAFSKEVTNTFEDIEFNTESGSIFARFYYVQKGNIYKNVIRILPDICTYTEYYIDKPDEQKDLQPADKCNIIGIEDRWTKGKEITEKNLVEFMKKLSDNRGSGFLCCLDFDSIFETIDSEALKVTDEFLKHIVCAGYNFDFEEKGNNTYVVYDDNRKELFEISILNYNKDCEFAASYCSTSEEYGFWQKYSNKQEFNNTLTRFVKVLEGLDNPAYDYYRMIDVLKRAI